MLHTGQKFDCAIAVWLADLGADSAVCQNQKPLCVNKSGCGFWYRGVWLCVVVNSYVTYMLHTGQKFDYAIAIRIAILRADSAMCQNQKLLWVDKSGCGFRYRGVWAGVGMNRYVTYMLHTVQKFDCMIVVWLADLVLIVRYRQSHITPVSG
jgi:hypothetical protein